MIALLAFVIFVSTSLGETRRLIKAPKNLRPRTFKPQLQMPGNDTWNAGYISFPAAGTTFHFFYWMIAARDQNPNAPTIFWFTGGPGCSSELATFAENGPWTFTDPSNMNSLAVNPFSWNNNANLVFIDQPVGTGFSYASKDVYERNEDEVAADVYAFTQGFFQKYPALLKNDLFITGESYGGHYVPAISNYIVSQNAANKNPQIPFKGCAIGNGLVDPKNQYPQYAKLAQYYGFINSAQVEKYYVEMAPCRAALSIGAYGTAYTVCNIVVQGIQAAAGFPNVYNVKAGCPVPGLCYQFSAVTNFLNAANVQAALGIPSGLQWQSCNFDVNGRFSKDWMHSMADRLLNVLASNYTVLIYSGKLDYICNFLGGRAWTAALQWPGQNGFNSAAKNQWTINLQNGTSYNAGTSQVYKNFAWLEVNNAGHMVPMDQPQAALQMINRFIKQGWRA